MCERKTNTESGKEEAVQQEVKEKKIPAITTDPIPVGKGGKK